MDRPLFLLVVAIVSALFGIATILAPANTAKGYGLSATPEIKWLFRILGAAVLSAGVMNFLVRNQPDSATLDAILLFNIGFYVIRLGNDLAAWRQKLFPINKIWLGELVHIFIATGSIFYFLTAR